MCMLRTLSVNIRSPSSRSKILIQRMSNFHTRRVSGKAFDVYSRHFDRPALNTHRYYLQLNQIREISCCVHEIVYFFRCGKLIIVRRLAWQADKRVEIRQGHRD